MENVKFVGKMNDKDLVLDFLKFSTISLLYMTEDIRKDIDFYRRAVKFNGIAIAWDFFDVCDREII